MYVIVVLHVLGACIWVGGHLILSLRFTPQAWRTKQSNELLSFEQRYEVLGMAALLLQVATGFHLASRYSLNMRDWFDPSQPVLHVIGLKLLLLLALILIAAHARFRVLPNIERFGVRFFIVHVWLVTLISVAFVMLGVGFRYGGI